MYSFIKNSVILIVVLCAYGSYSYGQSCTLGASTNGIPTASDTDGDGVNDVCDLDDDNDGILDSEEGGDIVTPSPSVVVPTTTNNSTQLIGLQNGGILDYWTRNVWPQSTADAPVYPSDFTNAMGTTTLNEFTIWFGNTTYYNSKIFFGDSINFSPFPGIQILGTAEVEYLMQEYIKSRGSLLFWVGDDDNSFTRNDPSSYSDKFIITFNKPIYAIAFLTVGWGDFSRDSPLFIETNKDLYTIDDPGGANDYQTFAISDPTEYIVSLQFANTGVNPTDRIGINSELIDIRTFTVYAEPTIRDTDDDGIADAVDLDSDNDGISDLQESGADAAVLDPDNNGIIDGLQFTDADADGLADSIETTNGSNNGTNPIKSNANSLPNYLDLLSDNDNLPDAIEAQLTVGYAAAFAGDADATDEDTDGDGVRDMYDSFNGFGGSFNTPQDTDGDLIFDYLDLNSDNDNDSDDVENGLLLISVNNYPSYKFPSYLDPNGGINDPLLMADDIPATLEVNYRETPVLGIMNFMRHGKHFQNGEEKHMYFGNSR